jgi:hypothetical protein
MQYSRRMTMVLAASLVLSSAALAEQSKQQPKEKTAAAAPAQPQVLGQYGDWGPTRPRPTAEGLLHAW